MISFRDCGRLHSTREEETGCRLEDVTVHAGDEAAEVHLWVAGVLFLPVLISAGLSQHFVNLCTFPAGFH